MKNQQDYALLNVFKWAIIKDSCLFEERRRYFHFWEDMFANEDTESRF